MNAAYRWFVGLIDPFAVADGPPPQRLWPFVRWALSGSEKAIALTLAVTFIAGLSELVAASFTGWIIDSTASGANAGFWVPFWPLILFGLIFFLVVRPILFAADAGVTSILLGPHLFPLVLSRLNRHTLGHSMRYFENDFAGRISQKALQTSRALTDVVTEVADVGIYSLAVFGGSLLLMASIDTRLLLIFVVWGGLYVVALRYFIPRVKRRSAARAGARTQVTGQIVDTLSNVAAVKLFAHNTFEDRATLRELEIFRAKALDFGVLSSGFRMVLMTLGGMLPLFSILGALYLWTTGTATPGDIAMTAMVSTRLSQLTNRIGRVAISIFTNLGEIQDGIDTLAPAHEITDRPDAAQSASGPGGIQFDGIRFAYGGKVTALKEFSLTIRAGEKIGLVGASGAGKSTIVSLLLRLYEVEQGRILLDGTDIRDLTQEALRQRISVVRQETSMFNRSALDNIRYGRPDATDEEVFDAARRASAHDFILTLQDHTGRSGYSARLGERGVKLSGGQRQRIALARAILKDAPVLVLDEATSALDSEVEAEIQAALAQVMQGKTVIAIAHRLSTIAQMDRIIVLEQGRIAEMGSHTELLTKKGLYARFWNRQSGGFLGAQDAAE
ncbi:ABC transporter ATP-binding protein [Puniceibacterium sediminis]|uniref:ATP-binding cassette, subfamily B n=1 Tax=Puniceibacterium sediminis TaxID=1608407 RepID=A0A238VQU1_9RHOB|nr:ABC transporter ATP-binding protein [Puniceibacterium sediminis]SNR36732.1 ATP-binding cassette, subfamily B [Puniceibacterium sediminis]